MIKRLRNMFRQKVEVSYGFYGDEKKTGVLLGFVPGEYQDTAAYPGKVMIKSTMAIVAINNHITEVPYNRVKLL